MTSVDTVFIVVPRLLILECSHLRNIIRYQQQNLWYSTFPNYLLCIGIVLLPIHIETWVREVAYKKLSVPCAKAATLLMLASNFYLQNFNHILKDLSWVFILPLDISALGIGKPQSLHTCLNGSAYIMACCSTIILLGSISNFLTRYAAILVNAMRWISTLDFPT